MDPAVRQRALIAQAVILFVPPHRPQGRKFNRGVNVAAVPGLAEQAAHGTVIQLILVVAFQDEVVEALLGDDVHHPGDGVGAVDGGGAVLQYLDTVDGDVRDRIQVDAVDLAARARRGKAPPVHQDQGAARVEAAQAEGIDAGAAGHDKPAETVIDLDAGSQGAGLQDFRGVGQPRQDRALLGDDRHRQRRAERVAADARTRDDDFLGGCRAGRLRRVFGGFRLLFRFVAVCAWFRVPLRLPGFVLRRRFLFKRLRSRHFLPGPGCCRSRQPHQAEAGQDKRRQ